PRPRDGHGGPPARLHAPHVPAPAPDPPGAQRARPARDRHLRRAPQPGVDHGLPPPQRAPHRWPDSRLHPRHRGADARAARRRDAMKAPDTKTSEGLLDVSRFDRSPLLGEEEAHALDALSSVRFFRHVTQQQRTPEGQALARLYEPIRAVLEYVGLAHQITIAWGAFLDHMRALGRPYFAWSPADWVAF